VFMPFLEINMSWTGDDASLGPPNLHFRAYGDHGPISDRSHSDTALSHFALCGCTRNVRGNRLASR